MDVGEYEFVSKKDISELIIDRELDKPIPWLFFNNYTKLVKNKVKTIICPSRVRTDLHYALNETEQPYNLNEESSETAVSDAVQPLLQRTIDGYASLHKMSSKITFSNNQTEKTATTTKNAKSTSTKDTKTRCDFICYLDNIPIVIGEEKKSGHDMNKCSEQLEENVGLMSPLYYNKVPFVLCYAAAGKFLRFFAYIRQCNYNITFYFILMENIILSKMLNVTLFQNICLILDLLKCFYSF